MGTREGLLPRSLPFGTGENGPWERGLLGTVLAMNESERDALLRMVTLGFSPPNATDLVGRATMASGLIVSTVDTNDLGFETGLVDKNGMYVVERYEDRETAEQGHKRWAVRAQELEEGDEVLSLGYPGLTEDQIVTVEMA